MTQFRTPNLGSVAYTPNQKAFTGYDPLEQFEKDFNAIISTRLIDLFKEQMRNRYGIKFLQEMPDGVANELVFNFNWKICSEAELHSVSHHVVINALSDAPEVIQNALLNISVSLPTDKLYEAKIICQKTFFDEAIFLGQLLLFATEVKLDLEPSAPRKRKGMLAKVEPT